MRIDAHLNLPQLVGARVPAPPRHGPDSHRHTADDLPLTAHQVPVDRERAVAPGSHVPNGPVGVRGASSELRARPWAPSGGRVVVAEKGTLVARLLSLTGLETA